MIGNALIILEFVIKFDSHYSNKKLSKTRKPKFYVGNKPQSSLDFLLNSDNIINIQQVLLIKFSSFYFCWWKGWALFKSKEERGRKSFDRIHFLSIDLFSTIEATQL